jgi:hypothetical protein
MPSIEWEKKVTKKDLDAAKDYLHLIFDAGDAKRALEKLEEERTTIQKFKVRDILRASLNELKPESNEDVQKQFVKMFEGEPLVPILLVRKENKVFIVDGYHRMCAAYYLDKECEMHCVLVGID